MTSYLLAALYRDQDDGCPNGLVAVMLISSKDARFDVSTVSISRNMAFWGITVSTLEDEGATLLRDVGMLNYELCRNNIPED